MRWSRRIALVTAILATVLVAATPVSAGTPGLAQLRVCGHNRVPFQGSTCARDESGRALKANEFDCSVRVSSRRAASFHAQFYYQGALQYQYRTRVRPGTRRELIGVYFHNTGMPAGGYACRFALGRTRLGKSFHATGPAANVLGPSACLGAHHVGIDECPRDESGAPLPPTQTITCSAVFARERGRGATVELRDSSGVVLATQQDGLSYPITEAGATFTSPTAVFLPGQYVCSFSVAGHRADRSFSVS